MLIYRLLTEKLKIWKESGTRKPLILRGARQVGKTTLVNAFGETYDQYLYFNIERPEDKELFDGNTKIKTLVDLLFLSRNKSHHKDRSTLIFIDEVQELPEVIEILRYFFEDYPHLHVIVTGSLLEFALQKIHKTPVGRVQFMELKPISFKEYLKADGLDKIIKLCASGIIENAFHQLIFEKFHEYALIGGLPEIVNHYLEDKNLSTTLPIYQDIIASYKLDIEKYAKSTTERIILRHIFNTAASEIDNRINLNNFGESSYSSTNIREALTSLEMAGLIKLVYPATGTHYPILLNLRKRPRLHFFDIGLINFQLGLHHELLTLDSLLNASKGKLVQQLVYQELNAIPVDIPQMYTFWVREDRSSSAEVDILYPYKNILIPIEIKSGAKGTLKSLQEIMDKCDHKFAIRLYHGPILVESMKTRLEKPFLLLNIPYYLAFWLDIYIEKNFEI